MNVASLERCKELYELSGWTDLEIRDSWFLNLGDKGGKNFVAPSVVTQNWICPAYNLGYLLRKLPESVDSIYGLLLYPTSGGQWFAGYYEPDGLEQYEVHADTPEDAACKLLVELIKQGIIKP